MAFEDNVGGGAICVEGTAFVIGNNSDFAISGSIDQDNTGGLSCSVTCVLLSLEYTACNQVLNSRAKLAERTRAGLRLNPNPSPIKARTVRERLMSLASCTK